jgi:DnaJ like chaperone protein
MRQAARIFNLAKLDVTGYEACAEQLVSVFKGNRKLLEDVLEGLFHIAKADEALHPQEEQFRARLLRLVSPAESATSSPATSSLRSATRMRFSA